jgi:GNAT superfamily N-acetyltransferase
MMTGMLSAYESRHGEFLLSADRTRLDLDVIHGFLTRSYWAEGISRESVERAIRHSFPFGLYQGDRQIGFARVITDFVGIAYLADVFVLPEYRGKGLARWMVQHIVDHPELRDVRRFLLVTRDAHGLYAKLGFEPLDDPRRYMALGRLAKPSSQSSAPLHIKDDNLSSLI